MLCFCLAQGQWHSKTEGINNTVSWVKDYPSLQKNRNKKGLLKTSWSIILNLLYLLFFPLAFSLNHWPIRVLEKFFTKSCHALEGAAQGSPAALAWSHHPWRYFQVMQMCCLWTRLSCGLGGAGLDSILEALSNLNNSVIQSFIYLEKVQLSTAPLYVTLFMTNLYKLQVLEQKVILYYPNTNCKCTFTSLLSVTQDLYAPTGQLLTYP